MFVLGARERIFEGSEVLLRGLGICKAGLCKVKRRLCLLGKMLARSRGKREAVLQLGKMQNRVLLVKRFAGLF